MTTQLERDHAYRDRQKKLGYKKICVMFPKEFQPRLVDFVAANKNEWEKLKLMREIEQDKLRDAE
jgi:hypothetical protein